MPMRMPMPMPMPLPTANEGCPHPKVVSWYGYAYAHNLNNIYGCNIRIENPPTHLELVRVRPSGRAPAALDNNTSFLYDYLICFDIF